MLLREFFAILLGPIAIRGYCFQRRSALRPASARPFHFGLSHARAGFCVQARANVDDLLLFFFALALRVRCLEEGQ